MVSFNYPSCLQMWLVVDTRKHCVFCTYIYILSSDILMYFDDNMIMILSVIVGKISGFKSVQSFLKIKNEDYKIPLLTV